MPSTEDLLTNLRLDVARLEGKVDAYAKLQSVDRADTKKLEGRIWALVIGVVGSMGTAILSLVMSRGNSTLASRVNQITNDVFVALFK